jgi:hypothetical protein
VELALQNLWAEMTYQAERRWKEDEDEEEEGVSS